MSTRSAASGGGVRVTPASVSIVRSSAQVLADRLLHTANAASTRSAASAWPRSPASPKWVARWQSAHRQISRRSRSQSRGETRNRFSRLRDRCPDLTK